MTSRSCLLLLLLSALAAACTALPATPGASTMTPEDATLASPSAMPESKTPAPGIGVAPEALDGLQVRFWHAFNGATADWFTMQLAGFNSLNPYGVVVFQTAYPDYRTLAEAVEAALAAGDAPHLAVALPEQALAWGDDVLDLTPYVHDPLWGLAEAEWADIPPVFWAQDEVRGKRYGVPALRSARLLVYNLSWAAELGFDQPPQDAAAFREQACAANQDMKTDADPANDGYGGWVVNADADPTSTLSWLVAFGGGAVSDGAYLFERDENEAALAFLKGLYDDHCAWLPLSSAFQDTDPHLDPGPYHQAFLERRALFITASLAELPRLADAARQANSPDQWTVLPFPGETTALVTHGPSYSVLASTATEQLAAWVFARWLLSPENQAGWVQATGLFPLRLSALDLLSSYAGTHPQWAAAVDLLPVASGTPQLASWGQVQRLLGDGMLYTFRLNVQVASVSTVLAEMDAMAAEFGGE